MRVKFKAIDAGPAGVRLPGTVVEVDATEGKALVEGGFAELVEDTPKKAKTTKDDENKKDDKSKKDGETKKDENAGAGGDAATSTIGGAAT